MKVQSILIAASLFVMIGCDTGSSENPNQSAEPAATEDMDSQVQASEGVSWIGTYKTQAACPGCDGVSKEIRLNENLTFMQTTIHAGGHIGQVAETGKFEWTDEDNQIIVIAPSTEQEIHYQLGDNKMVSMDAEGNKIEGEGFELNTLMK